MTIISIEGASAVGKTTTSSTLALSYGAFHVPEVNTWWKKPEKEYPEWFFERQADRWKIAIEKEPAYNFVIIDIDLFQPFWYNWSFNFTLFGGQTLEFIRDYYRPLLQNQKIGFPDKYYLLYTDEGNLRERKAKDNTRQRRGFELNLQFIEPQRRYFEALNCYIPGLIEFIESIEINKNVEKIIATIPQHPRDHRFSIELFDFAIDWLSRNKTVDAKN